MRFVFCLLLLILTIHIECLDYILPSLNDQFNSSIASGIFPQFFKSVLVTPIVQKRCLDHNDFNNHRPVSNLAFDLSRIDYCSSLLFGSTHDVTSHLQRIQNYAAGVILRLPKSSSITTHLKSLHWLPVKVRSTYKIACLCYHCHSCTAPSYVADIMQKKP